MVCPIPQDDHKKSPTRSIVAVDDTERRYYVT